MPIKYIAHPQELPEPIRFGRNEDRILSHFFTSTDPSSKVYAVTDAMPTQLWALLEGGYSRSPLGMRERFLAIFKEMYPEPEQYDGALAELAECCDNDSHANAAAFRAIMERASKFMSKWAVQYGHNSLKDSATDRVAVDRISIRGAKLLEESHLIAAQEKSTRYQDFSRIGFVLVPLFETARNHDESGRRDLNFGGVPDVLASSHYRPGFLTNGGEENYETEARALHGYCIETYTKILDAAYEHYLSLLDPSSFVSETALRNTAKAKAFDTARYTLLTCLPTALGFTMPTRETERRLSGWLASGHMELVDVAAAIHRGCHTYNDGLLTHVKPNKFQHRQVPYDIAAAALKNIEETVLQWSPVLSDSGTGNDNADLIVGPHYGETFVHQLAASLLKKSIGTNIPTTVISDHLFEVTDPSGDLSASVISERLQGRTRHDELPEEFAVGEFTCEIAIDYGAFRDLQRHRVGTIVCSDLDCSYGYEVPDLLKEPKFAHLHTAYCEYMDRVTAFHTAVRAINPHAAEYWFALGHKVQYTYTCDFRQLIYLCELRSQPAGHYSYRRVAQSLFDQLCLNVFPNHPHLRRLFFVDMSEPDTGTRADAENRAAAKLAELNK